jgi:crotonobetaine/carnitine-CoA ligase
VNVALKGQGLAYQMVQSDCVALVADLQYLDRLEGVAGELEEIRHIIYTDSAATGSPLPSWPGFEHLGYAEFSDRSQDSPGVAVHYSDLASILYTSGTTGVSKGVMFSHHYWYDIWAESVRYTTSGQSRSAIRDTPRMMSCIPACRFSTAMRRA